MNPLLALLDLSSFGIIGAILAVTGVVASLAKRQRNTLHRMERKLDALLQHHSIQLPSNLSPEVQRLASDPKQKIAAIKLHREQNAGLSLAEAKAEVEEFAG